MDDRCGQQRPVILGSFFLHYVCQHLGRMRARANFVIRFAYPSLLVNKVTDALGIAGPGFRTPVPRRMVVVEAAT